MFGRKKRKPLRQLITHKEPKSRIAEQYRNIRTNIEFTSVDNHIRSIIVTSVDPGDGKTTTIANLAVVFGQQGKKVLLIGADLRKPTLQNLFAAYSPNGLTNLLSGQTSFVQCIQKTDIENVYVMSAGPIPPNPAELLGYRKMDEVLLEAYKMFDIVLIDTPPVMAVTDAQILANKCDGVVLVARSEKTEKDKLIKVKQILDKASGKLLGVILNDKREEQEKYGYY
ncbi:MULTISPECIES: CpsD/CapB family tyrosine-protein kinase [Bacillus cereus group]|uniref:CpsD/CapB family tyrosine-protein kinase n=1 Tax=Bacillus cereus group TaxID=86661 RepID=UPI0001A20E1A|nr:MULTISPECIES: CpsD/CapB family tyrosine-protein kinase [Bacillus cereus group]OUB35895.1 tyrosine protein kinase [Bacillus thuringiensis serovar yunnanensis]EEM80867.1 Tyrosine-protein kinase [Bacillus thuringiensis serovar huazhongensis BGSC 4BD1]MCU4821701.1 CpsD/CapB family tyrosine-protein kinase [Bacillus cereus]MCU4854130.1 CpsD/CapB family tyrosine-protein kinase [Bacillus cereus]MCU4870840.1 CpsD/CapB family tyrosine-protein kinase [Bacillus cereus]